jgi:outer membrane protein OmpA-like peptidoglycan-associated protein
VQALVEYLNRYPDVNVVIVGYADAQTANPAYNLRLSERRARAVYDMLVKEFRVDPDACG